MNPIDPIPKPAWPPRSWFRVTYAKDPPEYIPLPGLKRQSPHGELVTRWRLTWRERLAILFGRDLYLLLLTFHQPLTPVKLTVGPPEDLRDQPIEIRPEAERLA